LYFIVRLDLVKYLSKNNYRFFFLEGVVLSGFAPKYLGVKFHVQDWECGKNN
jgi:hypothetical protein